MNELEILFLTGTIIVLALGLWIYLQDRKAAKR